MGERAGKPATVRSYGGRGKLLFFGEHAAVYGAPAVGVALPLGVTLTLEEGNGASGRLWGVRDEYRTQFLELLDAARAILADPDAFDGVDIRLESDLPPACGLGSSASLCVALMAAAARRTPAGRATSEELWTYAHAAERLFHGKPSGIDTGLASGEGIAALYPRPRGLPERRPLSPVPFWLVAGAVPRPTAAIHLIRGVGERYAAGSVETREAIRALGRVSALAIEAFSRAASTAALMETLAPLAEAAQDKLASLGLSTPELEEALAVGKGAGARVGKLSGAGGGGAFYFLASDREVAEEVHAALAAFLSGGGKAARTLFRPFFWTGEALVLEGLGEAV